MLKAQPRLSGLKYIGKSPFCLFRSILFISVKRRRGRLGPLKSSPGITWELNRDTESQGLLLSHFSRVLTLCDPTDGSPPGSSVPGILQARILEWVAIFFSNASMHAKSLRSCVTLCDPMDSSPPGSSVHRILQARILEWAATSFSLIPDLQNENLHFNKIPPV